MIRAAILALAMACALATAPHAQVALNLRDAELRSFVEIISDTTGRNFILDPRVRGTVTVYAPAQISDDALYEIFLNVLELNNLTIVEGAEADRIVPMDSARILSGTPGAPGRGGAYETRVLELRDIPLEEAVEVIRPLLPPEAVLSTVPDAGLLILSDRRENHTRIANLLERLDRPRQEMIETIRLRNGSAVDLLETLQALDITPAGASLSADARANAIVVSGDSRFRDRVRNVVAQLDTPQRNLQTAVVRLNYADADTLQPIVAGSFGAATGGGEGSQSPLTVVADPQSNALVVTAPSDRLSTIVQSIRSLDSRPDQVLIEAVIFELSVENFSDLSVQFAAVLNNAIAGGVEFSLSGRPTLSSLISSAVSSQPQGPGSGGSLGAYRERGEDSFAGFLSALISQTSTRLLSTPSIMTLNNTEAEIVVAQNVPFVTGSFATVGESAVPDQPFQTINREDVGLTLTVTPQITAEGTVRMEIAQQVSSLTNAASAAGGEITNKRELRTNVLVRDGRVIMLGGLLENGSGTSNQRVPGLSRLPLVGGLFRGRNVNKSQKVLLILMRPRIVGTDTEAERLTREVATETRRASEALAPEDDGRFPPMPETAFPFDGVDLNMPFEVEVLDRVARDRTFPPLPGPLSFRE